VPITKRVLFMYIAISSGHQRAAEAVMNALRQLNPRVSSHGIDSFTHAYPVLGPLVSRMYLEMLEHTPQIWSYLYDNPTVEEATREIRQALNVFGKGKIFKLLKKYHPRALVCTQALPVAVLSALRQKGKIKIPLIGVVTDFGVHSYWLSKHVDLYLVGSEDIKRDMVRRGVRENRILVTGIPIDPAFAAGGHKPLERQKLGLDPETPTVMIMGGSKGLGPVDEIVTALRDLPTPLQLIVVCGQNRSMLKKLQREFGDDPAVRLYGFTRNVPKLMDCADLLVTKPGGLTCAESMAKGLPMVIIRPIPGQEERNARYLLKHGAAERVENWEQLVTVVQRLFEQPDRLHRLQERARSLAKPHAAYDAAEAILKMMKEPVLHRPLPGGRVRYDAGAGREAFPGAGGGAPAGLHALAWEPSPQLSF